MKKYLALAAAGGALAIGVPAAFAATDAPSTPNTPVQSATPTPDQSRPDDNGPGGRGDCPEKDGNGGGGSSAPSTAPDNPGTTL
jgi:hypothetical protein